MVPERDLLSKIQEEYSSGLDYVKSKRDLYRKRLDMIDTQNKQKDKINIHMINNTIKALLAVQYSDDPTIKFVSRDGFLSQDKADKLNHVAKYDNDEADYQQLYYQCQWDKLFYGVGIRLKDRWDSIRSVPTFKSIDPLSWIPDPLPSQTGKWSGQDYRFHGFITQMTYFDMIESGLYDEEALEKTKTQHWNNEEENNRTASNRVGLYNDAAEDRNENFRVDIYHHYTKWYNDKGDIAKFHVVLTGDVTQILSVEELKPVLAEEKKDPSLIPRPVVLNYFEPRRRDPFGISVTDLLEDKQRAKSILFNLNIVKAKMEAFGGDMLVNSTMGINRQDLLRPTVNAKYISVDPGSQPLSNAVVEMPRSQIKTDSFNMIANLERESQLDSGIDAAQL